MYDLCAPAEKVEEPVIAQFTKTLRSLTITIFAYPSNSPRSSTQVRWRIPLIARFKPERFRVVQARLPEGTGSALVVSDTRGGRSWARYVGRAEQQVGC